MDSLQKAVSLLQQQFHELQCSVNNRFEDIEKRMGQLSCQGENANTNSAVTSTEVCTLPGSKPTHIIDEFKNINNRISRLDDRLSQLENTDNNFSTADMTQVELNYKAVIDTLQLQLTHSHCLSLESSESLKNLMEQIHRVTGLNDTLQDNNTDLQSRVDQLTANSELVFSKFEQLQLTIDSVTASTNSVHSAVEHEQMKALIDTLANSSVSFDNFCQLETTLDSLAKTSVSRDFIEQQLMAPIGQQMTQLKDLWTKQNNVTQQSVQLKAIVDEMARSRDTSSQQTLHTKQIVVKKMQREQEIYTRNLNNSISSLYAQLKEDISVQLMQLIKGTYR